MRRSGAVNIVVAMVLFCLLPLQVAAFADENWLTTLQGRVPAERSAISLITPQDSTRERRIPIFMGHSTFALDPSYLPSIEKESAHVLLQFKGNLTKEMKEQLHGYGVQLLEYIPSNTWKVRMPAARVDGVKSLGFVNAMGGIHPVDKFPVHVLEKGFDAFSYNDGGTLSLMVSFHKDVEFDRAVKTLKVFSAVTEQSGFLSGNRILLTVPPEMIRQLAECDEVNWIEDRPFPKGPDNADAAVWSNVDHLQNDAPYLLKGSGMKVGVWDGGEVQKFHPDLSTRVTIMENSSVNTHATHVAGTIAGNGSGNANAKGMAPLASIYSYDYNGDVPQEIISAPVALSNHSWGTITGWEYNYYKDGYWVWFGDSRFGLYSSTARAWDEKVAGVDDPILGGLILVKTSGNDRFDDGVSGGTAHYHVGDNTNFYYDTHPPDPDYGSIPHKGCAKNVITVGAMSDTGGMTSFSSWGPCDDGRIKPDIVANGDGLTSTCPTDTYCIKSGTSMACPVVTGALALIMQHYAQVDSTSYAKVTAYELKALLIQTAVDKGNSGPDYQYGWGLVDAKAAVDLVNQSRDHIRYDALSHGESVAYQVTVPAATSVLKVTAAWTDQPGTVGAAKALVNDLDLELIDPTNGIHRPWVLDKTNPSASATKGVNSLDNVEQVLVNSPQQGTWTIRMKGTDVPSEQAFAVVSNLEFPCSNIYYLDADGDGYGDSNAAGTIEACTQLSGYASNKTDCNDGDAAIHPGAVEKCNDTDDDCNPDTGDGIGETWYGDACDGSDGDLCEEGVYGCSNGNQTCSDATGDIIELCDDIDNDCNPATADGTGETWYGDACDGSDGDLCKEGVYGCSGGNQTCSDATGDKIELCDDIDNDCNPNTGDGTGETWYGDACDGSDGDLCKEGVYGCSGGSQTCSDATGDIVEVCDDIDNDCNPNTGDGSGETWYGDATSCGKGVCSRSGSFICSGGNQVDTCVPGSPPESKETSCSDWLDNDCDGLTDGADPDCISVAAFPFNEGFESGSLASYWIANIGGEGRIRVTTEASPHGGSYHLTMDDTTGNTTFSLNELTLWIDLSGQSNVLLCFYHKNFNDEGNTLPTSFTGSYPGDGVSMSADGTNWTKVQGLVGADGISSSYKQFMVDLDAAAASAGITYNSTFRIKFQQYDNYSLTTDGFAFDDIRLYRNVVSTIAYVKGDGLCAGKSPCYQTIQAAVSAASSGTTIRIAGGTYNETIRLNQSKSLILQGSWDASFAGQTSKTILRYAPKVTQGSVTLQMLKISP